MFKFFIPVIAIFTACSHVIATHNVQSIVNELHEICDLSQEELDLLSETLATNSPTPENNAKIEPILKKLRSCEARLECMLEDGEQECHVDMCASNEQACSHWCSWSSIAKGCDWFVRIAGVVWGIQILYGLLI